MDVFEELIKTIENSAIDNKVIITDVKLFAKSWRKEREFKESRYCTCSPDSYNMFDEMTGWCGTCGGHGH